MSTHGDFFMDTNSLPLTKGAWTAISAGDAFIFHSKAGKEGGKVVYRQSATEPAPFSSGDPVYRVTSFQEYFDYNRPLENLTLWAWATEDGISLSVTPLMQGGAPSGIYSGTRAITQQGYVEANIKNGVQYYFRKAYPLTDAGRGLAPIGTGESRYLLFTTTTKKVLFKTRVVSYIGEEFAIEIFVNPTLSNNGTQIAVSNYNGVNPVPTTVEVYKDVVPSDEGAPLDAEPEYYFGSSSQGQRTANSIPEGRERVLPENTTFLIKVTNTGSGTGRFQYFGDWYEGEPDLPLA